MLEQILHFSLFVFILIAGAGASFGLIVLDNIIVEKHEEFKNITEEVVENIKNLTQKLLK